LCWGERKSLGQFDDGAAVFAATDDGLEIGLVGDVQELIGIPVLGQWAADSIEGSAARILPGIHLIAVGFPEIRRQLAGAAVEQVDVVENLVVVVVLRADAQHGSLDAHIDVLRHQHDLGVRPFLRHRQGGGQDGIVRHAAGQAVREGGTHAAHLKEQPPAAIFVDAGCVLDGRQGDTVADGFQVRVLDQFVQKPAGLTSIAGNFGEALLGSIQFFQDDHGNEEVVLLEAEQRRGIVHQHIGVEGEELFAVLVSHGDPMRGGRFPPGG
jgi:hypothetical protein